MEFLDGPGLNSLIIARSKLLDGNRLTLARQAAEALEAVHAAGFIHRDICPRNFVCSPDATSLKLIDFGLTVPAEKEFMLPGNRTGTPNYMAPEVVRRKPTDQRLDIYSLRRDRSTSCSRSSCPGSAAPTAAPRWPTARPVMPPLEQVLPEDQQDARSRHHEVRRARSRQPLPIDDAIPQRHQTRQTRGRGLGDRQSPGVDVVRRDATFTSPI